MGLSGKNKKRLLIFLLIPILAVIPILVEDIVIRSVSTAILIIYVGFIIFLRDSKKFSKSKEDEFQPDDEKQETFESDAKEEIDQQTDESHRDYDFDDGEDFVILSPNKNIEIARSESSITGVKGRKQFFKPPDLKESFERIAAEIIPDDIGDDEQFGYVLEKILNVAKDAFLAHTAIFFWYNKSKSRLTLEKFVSGSKDVSQRKYDIEDDVLSKIVTKEEPEILSDITPKAEADIIRYYTTKQGIKSFVGVPLFYGKSIAGILALDSKDIDAFGIETIYSLGRFVRIISIMISIFEKKFEESRSEQRLKAMLSIHADERKFSNEEELFEVIETSIKNLLHWDAFTFVYYKPKVQKFYTSRIINKTTLKYVGENLEIELNKSLVGKAVISGQPVKIDDTSDLDQIRYSKSEDVSFDGTFLAIPLMYSGQFYGVLCFESLKKNAYTNSDIRFIRNASKLYSFITYSFSTQEVLKNLLALDIETKILNSQHFIERLQNDLLKSKQVEIPGTLALIKIDDFLEQESLFEGNPFQKVLSSVTQLIKEELPEINLFGRLDTRVFAVYFFNTSTKDTFLWAEKLRVKIARQPIAVSVKQTTYTVSIGVASTTNLVNVDTVLHNAELALNKALEKGGNSVKSIN